MMTTHDDLLIVVAVTSAIDVVGIALLGYFAYQSHRIQRAIVGLILDSKRRA